MPNTSRTASAKWHCLLVAALLASQACTTASPAKDEVCVEGTDKSTPTLQKNGDIISDLCNRGHNYRLTYSASKRTITLGGATAAPFELDRIPEDLDPSVVGAESDIRFLPPRLQPYVGDSTLLYLSAERSRGGGGMGQCGAGVERFLNVLNLQGQKPRRTGRILISSCWESIELGGSELPGADLLSAFSTANGRLQIGFLSHGDQHGQALLNDDLSQFVFISH